MLQSDAADRIRGVLPHGINPDKFIQTALSSYNRTPYLRECTPESVIIELIKCAEIGLVPNTALGHAYLVAYNNNKKVGNQWVTQKEAQLQIGYKGFIYLACRSDFFASVDAREVYAADIFDLTYTPEPVLVHKPYLGSEKGPTTHFYAYGVTRSRTTLLEMMTREQVERIRDLTTMKGKDPKLTPAWANYPDEMSKKTVMKRLLKDQPLGELFARAMEIDDEPYASAKVAKATQGQIHHGSRAEALAVQLEAPTTQDDASDLPEPGSNG